MNNVSVVMPVYNEEKCIDKTWEAVLEFSQQKPNYHFIFVSDGSTDNTNNILQSRLALVDTHNIELIYYADNKGKGYAVKIGVEYARGSYICYIDSDLAYSLEHLHFLVENLEYFDIVIGCRNLVDSNIKKLSLFRRIAGNIFNLISRIILNLPFADMQAGLKGFRKNVAEELFKQQTIMGFSFDVELIYLAKNYNFKIGEIPAIVSDSHLQKASQVKIWKDSFKMLLSLAKIKYRHRINRYENKYSLKL